MTAYVSRDPYRYDCKIDNTIKFRKMMDNNVKQIRLLVEGIVCSGCAMDMENILLDTDGITNASVNYADGIINIEFAPDEIDARDVFIKVRKLGYKTTVIS